MQPTGLPLLKVQPFSWVSFLGSESFPLLDSATKVLGPRMLVSWDQAHRMTGLRSFNTSGVMIGSLLPAILQEKPLENKLILGKVKHTSQA